MSSNGIVGLTSLFNDNDLVKIMLIIIMMIIILKKNL